MSLALKMAHAVKIIEDAIKEHDPVAVFASFSGGRDSVVVSDLFYRWMQNNPYSFKFKCFGIQTGLEADSWRQWVEDYCEKRGWEIEFYEGHGREWYTEQVLTYGFPYARSHHVNIYRYLKQSAIETNVRENKEGYYSRVIHLTGVRRDESAARSQRKIMYRKGARVGLNPIVDWLDEDVDLYIKTLLPDYDNPFYELYGSSGDCYCGWHCKHKAEDFREHSPNLYAYLTDLNDKVKARGGWCYGDRPDKETLNAFLANDFDLDEMPEDALCATCSRQKFQSS